MAAKESSKSGALEVEECMHVRSPRSEIQCDAPICLCFHLSSEHCTKLQKAETSPWETCGRVVDHFWSLQPPADHFLCWKTRKVVCQLVILVGRLVVAAEFQFVASESKKGHGNVFARYVCTTTLPIMSWTQGSVVLDPRATNHAFQCMMAERRSCTIQYEMNAQVNT